jgi:hypothetical protein
MVNRVNHAFQASLSSQTRIYLNVLHPLASEREA